MALKLLLAVLSVSVVSQGLKPLLILLQPTTSGLILEHKTLDTPIIQGISGVGCAVLLKFDYSHHMQVGKLAQQFQKGPHDQWLHLTCFRLHMCNLHIVSSQ